MCCGFQWSKYIPCSIAHRIGENIKGMFAGWAFFVDHYVYLPYVSLKLISGAAQKMIVIIVSEWDRMSVGFSPLQSKCSNIHAAVHSALHGGFFFRCMRILSAGPSHTKRRINSGLSNWNVVSFWVFFFFIPSQWLFRWVALGRCALHLFSFRKELTCSHRFNAGCSVTDRLYPLTLADCGATIHCCATFLSNYFSFIHLLYA